MKGAKKRLPFQDEWSKAMQMEDGLKLVEYLGKEPQLLTVKNKGCNVLHLAIRLDWYSLVEQILWLFEHLYAQQDLTGASSSKPEVTRSNPDNKEEKLNSSHCLGVEVLRNLLTAKEGEGGAKDAVYSSGLDCLGMAVIQCNMAVNTMLARAIQKIPELFPRGHPYHKVIDTEKKCLLPKSSSPRPVLTTQVDVEEPEVVPEGETRSSKEEAKKLLREVMASWLPDLTEWLTPDTPFHCCPKEIKKGFQAITDGKWASEQQLPEKVRKWILRAPYIPLAEYLLMEYTAEWSTERLLVMEVPFLEYRGECFKDKKSDENFTVLLREWLSEVDMGVIEYILGISDARRTVFHYAVSSNGYFSSDVTYIDEDDNHPIMNLIGNRCLEYGKHFSLQDAVGRKPIHLMLALAENSYNRPRYDFRKYCDISWDQLYCGKWEHDGWTCMVDLRSVHKVNGFIYYEGNPSEYFLGAELSAAHFIPISPHIGNDNRSQMLKSLIYHKLSNFNRQCCRPIMRDGYIQDERFSPLDLAVLMGDGELVERLVKVDIIEDHAIGNSKNFAGRSALVFAAQKADPEILRIILEAGKFDINYKDLSGNTVSHAAAFSYGDVKVAALLMDFLEIPRERPIRFHQLDRSETADQLKDRIRHIESGRQGCINLLLQEGLDIWEPNDSNRIADPGPKASPEYRLWWYEKLNLETREQKSSFSSAATAISVTAALVATASFIGSLQPPLGYSLDDEDHIAKYKWEIHPCVHFGFVIP